MKMHISFQNAQNEKGENVRVSLLFQSAFRGP